MSNGKRILVVARWPVGGIRTYFRYIYSQEVFDGYHFTFVMPADGELQEFLSDCCPNLNFELIDSGRSNFSLLKSLKRELRARQYSLVHSHGYTAGAVSSCALFFDKKTPHLMTAHEVFLDSQFEGFKGKLRYLGLQVSFKSMDAINVVSSDCRDNFVGFFPAVKEEKITTILHGVDTEYFYSAVPRDFVNELDFQEKFLIGFFGRFMSPKGFRYLVDAVQLLIKKDVSLKDTIRVLTFGWGGFIREEFEDIERKGLSDVFIMMPHTDDVGGALKGVDLVAMPSLWEACGLLAMEALVAGVPIVGTSCIGLREVLDGTPAFVVEPRNAEELACVISENVQSSSNFKETFKEYSSIAKDRFSLVKPAKELEQLYSQLS